MQPCSQSLKPNSDHAQCVTSSSFFLHFFLSFFLVEGFPTFHPTSDRPAGHIKTMLLNCDPDDMEGALNLIEELTTNAGAMQHQVLKEILTSNLKTEYLNGFLGEIDDDGGGCDHIDDAFKKHVPIVEYEQVWPYIERLANGDQSAIISSQPITELLTSSGTSGGQPKMMPSTAEELDRKTFMYNVLVPVMNKYVEGLDEGKGMYLLFIKPEISTPSGLMARPVLTSYYKSKNFRNRKSNKYSACTSPEEAILCLDSKQSMYCQLLCGLIQREEVLRAGAVFASAFLRAIKFLEDNWSELCYDIRTGELSSRITDQSCRESVGRILDGPNSRLADTISSECAKGWEGIVRRLWPRTKYVDVIVTGSMAQYIPTLKFYTGGLPLLSTMYASSECYFGINLTPLSPPEDVCYTLLPNMAYFEFLPVDMAHHHGEEKDKDKESCNGGGVIQIEEEEKKKKKPMELVDVEIGSYYELIVTTFTGLYRYRVGDILLVTGFHNSAPQFRFIHRCNVVLSIDTEKTNEDDLLHAVTQAKLLILEPLGILLTDYTSFADSSSIPGHYVLFFELSHTPLTDGGGTSGIGPKVMEECCEVVEAELDAVYRRCRNTDKSIGALEIRLVEKGSFDVLMDFCVSHGSSVNQYKTPRYIKSEEVVGVLEERVVGRFFSINVPKWEPKNMHAT